MKPLNRLPLRDQIHKTLVSSLVAGEIPPGAKVKDTEIAERLGISRTPAREALLRLEQEGFLENRVGRGFVVRPMVRRELEEIYPILIQLECMALRATPLPTPELLEELRKLGEEIGAKNQEPARRLELDLIWHSRLVEACGNTHLLRMIAQIKALIQRYLHAYILLQPRIGPSIDDHSRLLDLLAAGDLDAAVDCLATHWNRNLSVLLEVFEE